MTRCSNDQLPRTYPLGGGGGGSGEMLLAPTWTVPVIEGWMPQWYGYVPAAAKVREIEVFELVPVMLAGTPAVTTSNVTLCPTLSKTQVTVAPGATVIDAG